jgi:hypothetical protein
VNPQLGIDVRAINLCTSFGYQQISRRGVPEWKYEFERSPRAQIPKAYRYVRIILNFDKKQVFAKGCEG